ncbi:AEC family transporter [Paludibacterium yongneupense]|nr:AEC family transporter [Paludibacterium yongneupense]
MFVLMILVFSGYVCARKNLVNKDGISQISRLIIYLFNPALIILGPLKSGGGTSLLAFFHVLLVAVLTYAALIAVSRLYTALAGAKRDAPVYSLMFVFSNIGFIGIPVVESVFGPLMVSYVAIFIVIYNLLIYTYGVNVIQGGKEGLRGLLRWAVVRKMFNPGTFSCLLAIVLLLSNIRISPVVLSSTEYFGSCAVALAMMLIGMSLGTLRIASLLSDVKLWIFCFFKMIAFPLLALWVFDSLGWESPLPKLVVLLLAMPIGNMPSLLAIEYGGNDALCSRGVAITTLISVVTLPLIASLS